MNRIICILLVITCFIVTCAFSGCSVSQPNAEPNAQPETVIVKETVIVYETVFVNETVNNESNDSEQTQVDDKKGYTTEEVLQKAEAASDNQYWIVFFGEGSLQMATFNALENFTVTWTSDRELVCDKLVGSSIVKQWDSEKNTFTGNRARTDIAFRASEIVGSNCNIYDEKADTTISAKTQ